ncbi:MAG: hypothetical protein V3U55_10960 [Mycobacterium sp.]
MMPWPVTGSPKKGRRCSQPAPRLTVERAAEPVGLLRLPFLFFVDAAQERGWVLCHRYDAHCELVMPSG